MTILFQAWVWFSACRWLYCFRREFGSRPVDDYIVSGVSLVLGLWMTILFQAWVRFPAYRWLYCIRQEFGSRLINDYCFRREFGFRLIDDYSGFELPRVFSVHPPPIWRHIAHYICKLFGICMFHLLSQSDQLTKKYIFKYLYFLFTKAFGVS